MTFTRAQKLYGRGVGYVDVHLLAGAAIDQCQFWSLDERLNAVATRIAIAVNPGLEDVGGALQQREGRNYILAGNTMRNVAASSSKILNGKCLCGSIHYEVEDQFRYSLNCHCSNCRRATGGAFKPFAGIERGKLNICDGADRLLIFGDESGHDAHCGKCGSLLYSLVRDATFIHVTLGTLIDSPSIRPTAHIFVGSKAPWYTITDDLPQYEELP